MRTTEREHSARRGFTLLELLVVICIIAILAGLAVAAAFVVMNGARVKDARATSTRFYAAIDAYRTQQGCLPIQVLYNAETDPDAAYENCDVIRQVNGMMNSAKLLKVSQKELNASGSLVDPWGRPYRVCMWKNPGDIRNRFLQVYSCGPNGRWEHGMDDPSLPGKPDDIRSTQ